MPEGYTRIDAAFGLRMSGADFADGVATVPVVEFRTAGDYAMYPFTTACNGEFVRGAGLQFAADGTVRENIAPQPAASVASNPPFADLYQRICDEAKLHRFVADPFNAERALALLYGPLNEHREGTWRRPAGKGEEARTLLVSMRWSGTFSESGKVRAVLVTGSRDPACDVHACGGGFVGAASFVKDGGRWVLATDQREIFSEGQYGQVSASEAFENLRQGPGNPLLAVRSSCFGNGGYCESHTSVLAFAGGNAALAWSEPTSNDTTGSTECVEKGACTDWTSTLTVASQDSFPDLVLARSGKEWSEQGMQVVPVQEVITYRWSGAGKYVEVSRVAAPLGPPTVLDEVGSAEEPEPTADSLPSRSFQRPSRSATAEDAAEPAYDGAEATVEAAADAAASAADAASEAATRHGRLDLDERYESRRLECARGFLGSDCRRRLRDQLCEGNWTSTPEPGRKICHRN